MCGIVGYIGQQEATEILLEGLKRLEYRGYDSAGVAVWNKKNIETVRAEGKLKALETKLNKHPLRGVVGLGHTRWATHGRPTESNAHPHRAGDVVLVHNGIIENYQKLKAWLIKKGHTMKSETDTEVVCHLIQQYLYDGLSMEKAFRKTLQVIEGTYALVVLNAKQPDRLYMAKQGSPLILGIGKGENLIASDIPAVLSQTRRVIFLEDGDWGWVSRDEYRIFNHQDKKAKHEVRDITWSRTMAEKGGFKHFMLKEIYEQPKVLTDTLSGRVVAGHHKILLDGLEKIIDPSRFDRLYIIACGTSLHSGMVGKYWIESMAKIPVFVDHASEFRYRTSLVDKKTLVIAISQSGETADTLAAIVDARKKGATVISICNVLESSIPRASDGTLYTRAGPEIGVASTKAFTTQMILLFLLGLHWGQKTGQLKKAAAQTLIDALLHIPKQIEQILKESALIEKIALKYVNSANFLYFARGIQYPIALEGALKLKEISYIHAEGYPAGELKHGPIALIDSKMPVVVLAPKDDLYEKVWSNMQEVQARGAQVIAIGERGDKNLPQKTNDFFPLPKTLPSLFPFLSIIPLQLLAYYIADGKGTDVDQPRNLAKSVTVE